MRQYVNVDIAQILHEAIDDMKNEIISENVDDEDAVLEPTKKTEALFKSLNDYYLVCEDLKPTGEAYNPNTKETLDLTKIVPLSFEIEYTEYGEPYLEKYGDWYKEEREAESTTMEVEVDLDVIDILEQESFTAADVVAA